MNNGLLDEAKVDLLHAQQLDPANGEVIAALKTFVAKQKEMNAK